MLSFPFAANDEDSMATIFGGNITPPSASGSSRMPKIHIKMNGGTTISQLSNSSFNDRLDKVIVANNDNFCPNLPPTPRVRVADRIMDSEDVDDATVSSSSSPSKLSEEMPELGNEPQQRIRSTPVETVEKDKSLPFETATPIILKQVRLKP